MKLKSKLITGACIAALCCGPSLTFAASKKAASPAPAASPAAASEAAAKAPRPIPFHGKASEIDKKSSAFTIAGILNKRVFKVTDKTVITKMGNPAKFADLTDGEEVSGSYWKHEDGNLEAKSLKIGGKTEAEKAAAAAAKEKKAAKKAAMTEASEEKPDAQKKETDAAASPSPAKKK